MRIAICDDDELYMKKHLKIYLENVLYELNISADIVLFTDGNELLKEFEKENMFDTIILDIDMPCMNGKELAGILRMKNSYFHLIFVSSYKNEVYSTLQYKVDAFIPKDSEENFFLAELKRVFLSMQKNVPEWEWFEIIDQNKEKQRIKVLRQDIYYFSSVRRHICLHTCDNKYDLAERILKTIQDKYWQEDFYEVCRGLFVNLNHVKIVKQDELLLDNNEPVVISRRKKDDIIAALARIANKENI